MSSKKRWFGKWEGSGKDQMLFPNSYAKHQKKFDEDGFEILEEDDTSYLYDFDTKLSNNSYKETGDIKEDNKNKYGLVKSEYQQNYSEYEKSGVWRGYGYYQTQTLSYKYVQQMANLLSAQHNIKVEIGNNWKIDLINKVLTYNPASLIFGTKSELIATLMHEIGKIRYVTHPSLLQNKYLIMYGKPAFEVLASYEDLRTDYLMLKNYVGASEIYESIIPTIELQVKGYMSLGNNFRDLTSAVLRMWLRQLKDSYEEENLKVVLLDNFGISDIDKIEQKITLLKQDQENIGNIYDYCGEMISLMYDLDKFPHKEFENIKGAINKTINSIEPSKEKSNSNNLINFLDSSVFPEIENLLKEAKSKEDTLKKYFPDMPSKALKEMSNKIIEIINGYSPSVGGVDATGSSKSRRSTRTDDCTPPEWSNGDYKVLKDSVEMEIKQLINRLTFLRREEQTVKYTADQKRGKLNSKKLYKSSTGSRRLFKKKLEGRDTIQSFAFSILLDVSGSMSGNRIVHSTRALVMFTEVFKRLQIPFEITAYSDGTEKIKKFEDDVVKSIENSIGGLPQDTNGGTNLNNGLDALRIEKREEKNKIVIILTDGDVGEAKYYDEKYFTPMLKKGIKSVGFGLECGREIEKLCLGNSKLLNNPCELPNEFSNLIKTLIKR